MSVNNTALLFNLGIAGYFVDDGNVAQGSTQGTALRKTGDLIRVVGGALNSGIILPAIGTGEAVWIMFVINDGPNAIRVYCGAGENHNGVGNSFLAIPAGQSGVFSPILNSKGGTLNWSSAVLA